MNQVHVNYFRGMKEGRQAIKGIRVKQNCKKKAVEILKKHSWFAIPMIDPVPFPILHEGGSKAGHSK